MAGRYENSSFGHGGNAPNTSRIKLTKSLSTPPTQTRPHVVSLNRSMSRPAAIREALSTKTIHFFGINGHDNPESTSRQNKWDERRRRHCTRRYGLRKDIPPVREEPDGIPETGMVPMRRVLHPDSTLQSVGIDAEGVSLNRSMSIDSRSFRAPPLLKRSVSRRDSVAKMAWDGLATLVKSATARPRTASGQPQQFSRSFAPATIAYDLPESDYIVGVQPTPIRQRSDTTVILDQRTGLPITNATTSTDVDELSARMSRMNVPLAEDEITSADDIQYIERRRLPTGDTYPGSAYSAALTDDVFFDQPPSFQYMPAAQLYSSVSAPVTPYCGQLVGPAAIQAEGLAIRRRARAAQDDEADGHVGIAVAASQDAALTNVVLDMVAPSQRAFRRADVTPGRPEAFPLYRRRQKRVAARITHADEPLLKNIWSRLANALSKPNRRKRRMGEGLVGRLFGRSLKRKSELSSEVRAQLDDFDDHRPFFTYWVTTVQILVMIVSLASYGLGPIGFNKARKTAPVLHTSLVMETVDFQEQENFWIGPRFADLVHLGGKYSPCMRRDRKIFAGIEEVARNESLSGCCIRTDHFGCFQARESACSSELTKWHNWRKNPTGAFENRMSGPVCGQDPRACSVPHSIHPYKWADDISKWPLCTKPVNASVTLDHMLCEIIGHPCCIGIQGQCRITTRQYCDFVEGYFHEEATLCSQVSCLKDVCGMIPFRHPSEPDQFYRLFIALFLHAGIFHVICTVFVQYFLMRDLEKLVGWLRLALIYFGAGIGGNLASAVFVPYQAEVGPAGSHFGLLAALFVDAIYSWKLIQHPWKAVLQLSCVLVFLFLLGLLPWIDNWAHLFGFAFGMFLSFAVFPYIQFGTNYEKTIRVVIVLVSLALAVGLFAVLVVLFYVNPLWDCPLCFYFNCIPFTSDFCDNQGLSLSWLPI